jgi:hypothetical protein
MLRKVFFDKKSDGSKISIPIEVNEKNIEQQIKIFIEMTDYNTFDGQLHISHFRHYHGKEKTIQILKSVIQELNNPSIELDIRRERKDLLPFFEAQLSRHEQLEDKEFGYPGDRSKLPL